MTKYLARLGHRVTVLTSTLGGTGPVPGAARTIRTPDLLVSRFNWRRSNLAGLKGEADGSYAGRPSTLASWVVPDLEVVGWTPFALARAVRLTGAEWFDCAITTSPPNSAHLIGLALHQRQLPWVADFRDGWTFESQRPPWAVGWLEWCNHSLERQIIRRADALSAVTEPIAADLRDRYGRSVLTITNGFDPDAVDGAPLAADGLLSSGRCSIVHTGNLAYGGRSLGPVLDAVRTLRASSPRTAERLEVVLVGPITTTERKAVEQSGLGDAVRFTGPVPHETALALQHAADGLLVITGPGQSGVATGKLYEYLIAGRPILVIGDDTAAAQIVERVGAGIAVSRDDCTALAATLRRFVETPEALPRAKRDALTAFAYPALAEQMIGQVERAIAARAKRQSRPLV